MNRQERHRGLSPIISDPVARCFRDIYPCELLLSKRTLLVFDNPAQCAQAVQLISHCLSSSQSVPPECVLPRCDFAVIHDAHSLNQASTEQVRVARTRPDLRTNAQGVWEATTHPSQLQELCFVDPHSRRRQQPSLLILMCDNISANVIESLNSLLDINESRYEGRQIDRDLHVVALLSFQETISRRRLATPFYERFTATGTLQMPVATTAILGSWDRMFAEQTLEVIWMENALDQRAPDTLLSSGGASPGGSSRESLPDGLKWHSVFVVSFEGAKSPEILSTCTDSTFVDASVMHRWEDALMGTLAISNEPGETLRFCEGVVHRAAQKLVEWNEIEKISNPEMVPREAQKTAFIRIVCLDAPLAAKVALRACARRLQWSSYGVPLALPSKFRRFKAVVQFEFVTSSQPALAAVWSLLPTTGPFSNPSRPALSIRRWNGLWSLVAPHTPLGPQPSLTINFATFDDHFEERSVIIDRRIKVIPQPLIEKFEIAILTSPLEMQQWRRLVAYIHQRKNPLVIHCSSDVSIPQELRPSIQSECIPEAALKASAQQTHRTYLFSADQLIRHIIGEGVVMEEQLPRPMCVVSTQSVTALALRIVQYFAREKEESTDPDRRISVEVLTITSSTTPPEVLGDTQVLIDDVEYSNQNNSHRAFFFDPGRFLEKLFGLSSRRGERTLFLLLGLETNPLMQRLLESLFRPTHPYTVINGELHFWESSFTQCQVLVLLPTTKARRVTEIAVTSHVLHEIDQDAWIPRFFEQSGASKKVPKCWRLDSACKVLFDLLSPLARGPSCGVAERSEFTISEVLPSATVLVDLFVHCVVARAKKIGARAEKSPSVIVDCLLRSALVACFSKLPSEELCWCTATKFRCELCTDFGLAKDSSSPILPTANVQPHAVQSMVTFLKSHFCQRNASSREAFAWFALATMPCDALWAHSSTPCSDAASQFSAAAIPSPVPTVKKFLADQLERASTIISHDVCGSGLRSLVSDVASQLDLEPKNPACYSSSECVGTTALDIWLGGPAQDKTNAKPSGSSSPSWSIVDGFAAEVLTTLLSSSIPVFAMLQDLPTNVFLSRLHGELSRRAKEGAYDITRVVISQMTTVADLLGRVDVQGKRESVFVPGPLGEWLIRAAEFAKIPHPQVPILVVEGIEDDAKGVLCCLHPVLLGLPLRLHRMQIDVSPSQTPILFLSRSGCCSSRWTANVLLSHTLFLRSPIIPLSELVCRNYFERTLEPLVKHARRAIGNCESAFELSRKAVLRSIFVHEAMMRAAQNSQNGSLEAEETEKASSPKNANSPSQAATPRRSAVRSCSSVSLTCFFELLAMTESTLMLSTELPHHSPVNEASIALLIAESASVVYGGRLTPEGNATIQWLFKWAPDSLCIRSSRCSICLSGEDDEANDDDESGKIFVELPCEHQFHHVCIEQWFSTQRKPICPLCRKDVHGKEVVVFSPYAFESITRRAQTKVFTFCARPVIERNPSSAVSSCWANSREHLQFVQTASARELMELVQRVIDSRNFQTTPTTSAGRKIGLIVEGPSGRGKDLIIDALLRSNGLTLCPLSEARNRGLTGPTADPCFLHISAALSSPNIVVEAVECAVRMKACIVVSELNILPCAFADGLLSKLSALLESTQSVSSPSPFFFFGTVNPPESAQGRFFLSAAMERHFIVRSIPNYPSSELRKIALEESARNLNCRRLTPDEKSLVVRVHALHMEIFKRMADLGAHPEPTLRKLLQCCSAVLVAFRSQTSNLSEDDAQSRISDLVAKIADQEYAVQLRLIAEPSTKSLTQPPPQLGSTDDELPRVPTLSLRLLSQMLMHCPTSRSDVDSLVSSVAHSLTLSAAGVKHTLLLSLLDFMRVLYFIARRMPKVVRQMTPKMLPPEFIQIAFRDLIFCVCQRFHSMNYESLDSILMTHAPRGFLPSEHEHCKYGSQLLSGAWALCIHFFQHKSAGFSPKEVDSALSHIRGTNADSDIRALLACHPNELNDACILDAHARSLELLRTIESRFFKNSMSCLNTQRDAHYQSIIEDAAAQRRKIHEEFLREKSQRQQRKPKAWSDPASVVSLIKSFTQQDSSPAAAQASSAVQTDAPTTSVERPPMPAPILPSPPPVETKTIEEVKEVKSFPVEWHSFGGNPSTTQLRLKDLDIGIPSLFPLCAEELIFPIVNSASSEVGLVHGLESLHFEYDVHAPPPNDPSPNGSPLRLSLILCNLDSCFMSDASRTIVLPIPPGWVLDTSTVRLCSDVNLNVTLEMKPVFEFCSHRVEFPSDNVIYEAFGVRQDLYVGYQVFSPSEESRPLELRWKIDVAYRAILRESPPNQAVFQYLDTIVEAMMKFSRVQNFLRQFNTDSSFFRSLSMVAGAKGETALPFVLQGLNAVRSQAIELTEEKFAYPFEGVNPFTLPKERWCAFVLLVIRAVFGPILPAVLAIGRIITVKGNRQFCKSETWVKVFLHGNWCRLDLFPPRFPVGDFSRRALSRMVPAHSPFSRTARRWQLLDDMSSTIASATAAQLGPEFYCDTIGFSKAYNCSSGRIDLSRLVKGYADFYELTVITQEGPKAKTPRTIVFTGFPYIKPQWFLHPLDQESWRSQLPFVAVDDLSTSNEPEYPALIHVECIHQLLQLGFQIQVWDSGSKTGKGIRRVTIESAGQLFELIDRWELWNCNERVSLNAYQSSTCILMNAAAASALLLRVAEAYQVVLRREIPSKAFNLSPQLVRAIRVDRMSGSAYKEFCAAMERARRRLSLQAGTRAVIPYLVLELGPNIHPVTNIFGLPPSHDVLSAAVNPFEKCSEDSDYHLICTSQTASVVMLELQLQSQQRLPDGFRLPNRLTVCLPRSCIYIPADLLRAFPYKNLVEINLISCTLLVDDLFDKSAMSHQTPLLESFSAIGCRLQRKGESRCVIDFSAWEHLRELKISSAIALFMGGEIVVDFTNCTRLQRLTICPLLLLGSDGESNILDMSHLLNLRDFRFELGSWNISGKAMKEVRLPLHPPAIKFSSNLNEILSSQPRRADDCIDGCRCELLHEVASFVNYLCPETPIRIKTASRNIESYLRRTLRQRNVEICLVPHKQDLTPLIVSSVCELHEAFSFSLEAVVSSFHSASFSVLLPQLLEVVHTMASQLQEDSSVMASVKASLISRFRDSLQDLPKGEVSSVPSMLRQCLALCAVIAQEDYVTTVVRQARNDAIRFILNNILQRGPKSSDGDMPQVFRRLREWCKAQDAELLPAAERPPSSCPPLRESEIANLHNCIEE